MDARWGQIHRQDPSTLLAFSIVQTEYWLTSGPNSRQVPLSKYFSLWVSGGPTRVYAYRRRSDLPWEKRKRTYHSTAFGWCWRASWTMKTPCLIVWSHWACSCHVCLLNALWALDWLCELALCLSISLWESHLKDVRENGLKLETSRSWREDWTYQIRPLSWREDKTNLSLAVCYLVLWQKARDIGVVTLLMARRKCFHPQIGQDNNATLPRRFTPYVGFCR